MKILIAVPTFESIYPDTYKAIFDVDRCGHDILFEYVRGYDCATARNSIAQKAMDLNTDYVLMVDNDVRVPSETLRYLLEVPVDVCLGFYAHRWRNAFDGRTNLCRLGEFNYTDINIRIKENI